MNNVKRLLTGLLVIISLNTLANINHQLDPLLFGDRTGSGGDGLVCFKEDGSIDSVEVWDYVEAEVEHGHTIDLGPDNLSYFEKMELVVNRVLSNEKEINTGKFKYLRQYLKLFRTLGTSPTSNEFVKIVHLKGKKANFQFKEIDDAKSMIVLAKGGDCRIVQLAVQEELKSFNRAFIKIQKELWDTMDNNHRAGILLHELFLMIQRKNNPKILQDTRYSRYLNVAFSTSQYELISQDQTSTNYLETLASVGYSYKYSFIHDIVNNLSVYGFADANDIVKMGLESHVDKFTNTILKVNKLNSKVWNSFVELKLESSAQASLIPIVHDISYSSYGEERGGNLRFYSLNDVAFSSVATIDPQDKIIFAKSDYPFCNPINVTEGVITSGILADDVNIITELGDRIKALKGTFLRLGYNSQKATYFVVKAPITLKDYDGTFKKIGQKGQFVRIDYMYNPGPHDSILDNDTYSLKVLDHLPNNKILCEY